MPTIANAKLPKPSSWDEFESICLSSFNLRWKSTNLTRHGRQGQAQQGVDIYGLDDQQRLCGIQCKNTIGQLSQSTIDSEILLAEKFKPSIASLFIATTADTDTKLQSYVRHVSADRHIKNKFTVAIVFWDGISHDLSADTNEVAKHYPQFFGNVKQERPVTIKRDRDIEVLKGLLSFIDIDSTDQHLAYAPKYIKMKFLETIDNFLPILKAPLFDIYDAELKSHLLNWLYKWIELGHMINDAPYEEVMHIDSLRFLMPGDLCRSSAEQIKLENITKTVKDFFQLQDVFCKHVRQNYLEIDLAQTSADAR